MSLKKKEAAALLGISTRQLENYARQGRITVRKERGKTGDISVYDVDEINQLKNELDAKRGVVQAAVVRESAEASESEAGDLESSEVVRAFASQLSRLTPQEFIAQLAAAILTQAEQRQTARQLGVGEGEAEQENGQQRPKRRMHTPDETPISDLAAKPLLTRAEARRYTGLSQQLLREAVTSGKVSEHKLGHAYRLKRAELDNYVAGL
jgi:excisionase family DNA binding protein